MATWKAGTVTSTTTFSMTMSGTTTKTGTISWTAPTLPDGATITGTTLTGTPSYSGRGNVNTLQINGTSCSLDTQFNISLGTTLKTSVSVSARGSNKNSTGTLSINNIVYTVEYNVAGTEYTVRFLDWNGNVLDTQTVEEGEDATPPSNPSRTGYDFTGWQGSYTNITQDTDIIAQYKIKTFTVRFLDWNNDVLDTQTVDYGGSALPPNNPTREGYNFIGWQGSYTNITANTDIIAQYQIKTFTVRFLDWDNSELSVQTVDYGSDATPPSNPSREGYDFAGWQGTYTNITANTDIIATYTESVPVISRQGIFTPSMVDLDISAYLDETSPFSNAYGKSSDNEGDYAEWGLVTGGQAYTYVCWGFDLSSIPSNATITNVTCSARCSNTNESIMQGGNTLIAIGVGETTKVASDNASFGTTATVVTVSSADFTREELDNFRLKIQAVRGYLSTSTSYHTKFYGATLTIDYTIPITEHTVRFLDWNGDVIDTQTIVSGNSATAPPYPTRDGYLCIGWDNYNYTEITSNLDITAQYVQEQGTPSDNIFPLCTTWNRFYDTQLIQATEHSISLYAPKGIGSSLFDYPEEWKGKDITISLGSISDGSDFSINDIYFNSSNGMTHTINIPVGTDTYFAFVTYGDTIIWMTDLYATIESKVKNINVGDTKINSIYLGDSKIIKVYLGDTLLFE